MQILLHKVHAACRKELSESSERLRTILAKRFGSLFLIRRYRSDPEHVESEALEVPGSQTPFESFNAKNEKSYMIYPRCGLSYSIHSMLYALIVNLIRSFIFW